MKTASKDMAENWFSKEEIDDYKRIRRDSETTIGREGFASSETLSLVCPQ